LTRRRTCRWDNRPDFDRSASAAASGAEYAAGAPLASPIRLLGVILETAVQDKGQLVEDIIEVIVKEGMVDRDKVQPDATIDSLDLKSIDIVMILTAIEEKFDVYIPMDGSFQDAKDVQGLIDAIAVHIMKEKEKENRAYG
jgi:acyl carrier protein